MNPMHSAPCHNAAIRHDYSQASAHASPSPAASFGLVSIFLATTVLGLVSMLVGLCALETDVRLPVVAILVVATGRPLLDDDCFASPLGRGFFDLACACALSHPAKSGSPPSSNDGVGVDDCVSVAWEGASKKDSPPRSPQASSNSSSSSWTALKKSSVVVLTRTGADGGARA